MLSFIWKHFRLILSEPQCFSTRTTWIKQRSSLVNPTVVTILQFIRTKTELVRIGRGTTTPFNENHTWVNKHCKYDSLHLTREETQIPKGCHFSGPPCRAEHHISHTRSVFHDKLKMRAVVSDMTSLTTPKTIAGFLSRRLTYCLDMLRMSVKECTSLKS